MPTLVFPQDDAPQLPCDFDEDRLLLTMPTPYTPCPTWLGTPSTDESLLLDKGVCVLQKGKSKEIVIMRRCQVNLLDERNPLAFGMAPDSAVEGLDFRSKVGKRMDTQRREYGFTTGQLAAKAQGLDAQLIKEKRMQSIAKKRAAEQEDLDRKCAAQTAAEAAIEIALSASARGSELVAKKSSATRSKRTRGGE